MAYDAATGTVVLYGGAAAGTGALLRSHLDLGRHDLDRAGPGGPPECPGGGSMVYDAATGTVVLFGGVNPDVVINGIVDRGTWTWG